MKIRHFAFYLLTFLLLMRIGAQAQNRTVIDTELGSFFNTINGLPMSDWGAYLMVSSNYTGSRLAPQAVKINYSRFVAFSPSDSSAWPYFPYAKLRSYEASEVAAGRPPIFMTATYRGKRRPLLFSWDLHLANNRPTTPSSTWHYPVNVGDPRFVKFWINQYLRPILWKNVNTTQNVWFGLDETAMTPAVFGVLDDSGNFVSSVQWDEPFPESPTEWMAAVKGFFDQAHQIAPEIRLMPNMGAISDPTRFSSILANVPGILYENFWDGPSPVAYTRDKSIQAFANVSAWGTAGKVAMVRELVSQGTVSQLRTAFALYEIVKGPNFFFDPMYRSTINGVPPSAYQSWMALLGNPTGTYTSTPQSGQRSGYNLYSRTFDGGIVYLNWTGVTKTITLPSGTYYDPNGNRVTAISIPDGVGTFVSTSKIRVDRPQISPRYGSRVSGPISVTLSCDTPNAAIKYTTDGSTPTTNSRQYGGPVELYSSATIRAAAFRSGLAGSSIATALYNISSASPSVQFSRASDTGLSGTGFPLLTLSSVSTQTVSVSYTVHNPNGTTAQGTATILPGDTFGHFAVNAPGRSGQRFTVTLTGARNATVGQANAYSYIIQ